MFRHIAPCRAVKPRIIGDFDLPPKRAETGPPVKSHGGWMIESAGVYPDPADRPRPRQLQRAVHQPAAGTGAYQLRGYTEEGEFALACGSKIELKQTFVAAVLHQCIYVDQRRANDAGQFSIGHPYARKPQPLLAD